LRWIAAGYGYEITGVDVFAACSSTLAAARNGGWVDEAEEQIHAVVASTIDRQGPHRRVAGDTNDLVTFKPVPAKAAARRVTAAAIRLTNNALLARQHRCC